MAELGRNGRPGLRFERGWHWEHARGTGNRSRVAALAEAGGAELATAYGGAAAALNGRRRTETATHGAGLPDLAGSAVRGSISSADGIGSMRAAREIDLG